MSNYAYGGYGSPDRIDTSGYQGIYNNMSEGTRIGFDYGNAPDLAYESWLRSLMPSLSNSNERTLRSAYGSILNNFLSQRELGSPSAKPFRWVDFLQGFNPNKELSRMSPSARYENPTRFVAPARWVSF